MLYDQVGSHGIDSGPHSGEQRPDARIRLPVRADPVDGGKEQSAILHTVAGHLA
jgi:hypothetical protein